MRKIMVATDGSDGANRAVDVAAELTKALGGSLLIVTIGETLTRDEARQLARAERDIADALESLADQILLEASERARRIGVAAVEVKVAWGDAAEAIIETAQRAQADAVVVGRRGRGRLSGLVLGSVSQKVTSHAPCVVIVVP